MLSNVDKKCAIAFFEIETERFAKIHAGKISYKEPSKFPAIEIDMTFVADLGATDFRKLLEIASNESCGMLTGAYVKDIYTTDTDTAVTVRFAFEAKDRTLSKQELAPITENIATKLNSIGLALKA